MKKRLFAAINLDSKTLDRLAAVSAEAQDKLAGKPGIRFVSDEHWHITLSFLGYQDDAALPGITSALEIASQSGDPFEIAFDRIMYGPPRAPRVRMIWAMTDEASSRRIAKIKNIFEDELDRRGTAFDREHRPFAGHITLARFNGDFDRSALPAIEAQLSLRFEPKTIELMESELSRSGAEYAVLQQFSLSKD